MHLLVIEDERALCETIVRSLRRLAYSVDYCYDGEKALALLGVERYDLVLLDLNLPKKDGMTVLRTLRQTDRETRGLIPPPRDRLPILYFAPSEFTYDKTQGNMQDWPRFGVWMDGLLAGRGQLPLALQTEVHALTDTIPDKRGKIEALYRYLGRTTRYVSIQLGIGGWQPMDAATVYANKFGDCKALSNYLHAMLAACDIESFYTIIHTQNKHIPRDFATPAIANHAILGVPCQRDTLWLECTNTDVPFGYVHQSIAGHDAVICHDGKAEVVTLPAYADSLNTECQRIDVRLDEAGNASLSLSSVSRARQYEWTRPILDLARDKQADFLRRSFQLPLAQVDSLRCEEVLDKPLPEMHIRASITALRYANKTGSRLFVPVAPLRSGPGRFTTERRHDLWIDKGYCDTDSLTLHLPEGYVVEALPKSVTIENRFEKVAFEALCSGDRLHIRIRLLRRSGRYPQSEYAAFREFMQAVDRVYSAKIVLRKV